MKLYKKTQYAYWLYTITTILIILQVILCCVLDFGKNSHLPAVLTSFTISSLFLIISLIFGSLTIEITETKISAYFNFKIFKQEITFSEIDYSTIKVFKPPFIYGIGLRLTPKGTLYNVKFGKAIWLQSKSSSKTFFVGTEDAELIKSLIEKR